MRKDIICGGKFGRLIIVAVLSFAITAFYSTNKTVFADGETSDPVHHDDGSSDDSNDDKGKGKVTMRAISNTRSIRCNGRDFWDVAIDRESG